MTATPPTLETALRLSGYTIDAYEYAGRTVNTESGPLVIPPMILSKLTWRRADSEKTLGSAFYLDRIPAFIPEYAPVQLSVILDRFRSRRLGYDTPDEFGLAVRRWSTLNMGALSIVKKRYMSGVTTLPLDDLDLIRESLNTASDSSESSESRSSESDGTAGTNTSGLVTGSGESTVKTSDTSESSNKDRDAQSDFPSGQISGTGDYASGAIDRVGNATTEGKGETTSESSDTQSTSGSGSSEDHRQDTSAGESSSSSESESTGLETQKGRHTSIMELLELARASFINPDEELVQLMEPLFLSVFDRSETRNVREEMYGPRYPMTGLFGW